MLFAHILELEFLLISLEICHSEGTLSWFSTTFTSYVSSESVCFWCQFKQIVGSYSSINNCNECFWLFMFESFLFNNHRLWFCILVRENRKTLFIQFISTVLIQLDTNYSRTLYHRTWWSDDRIIIWTTYTCFFISVLYRFGWVYIMLQLLIGLNRLHALRRITNQLRFCVILILWSNIELVNFSRHLFGRALYSCYFRYNDRRVSSVVW